MKRFKKDPPPSGRQRLLNASPQAPNPYIYRARRSDEALNTGRKQPREPLGQKLKLRQRTNFWLHRFGLLLLLLAVIISLFNVLMLSTSAKVVPLASNSQLYLHGQATYQAAASKLLSQSIWDRNKLTIDTAGLSSQLRQEFPELAGVSVTLPLLAHRPIFYLQPAQPALILTTTNGSFVIDTGGKALLRGSSATLFNHLGLPIVNDQENLKLALGQQAMTSNDVSFVLTVVTELAAKHLVVTNFTLPSATRELDAHLAGQPFYIKFNLQSRDARQQAGTFLATIATLQNKGITPSQYVDVRLDGRAYYQ